MEKYLILIGNAIDLAAQVNEHIAKGYRVTGGVTTSYIAHNHGVLYAQAMLSEGNPILAEG